MSSDLIRAARSRHGLSQRSLAIRAGTSQAWISQIESGRASPTTAMLARLLLCVGERVEIVTAQMPGHDLDAQRRSDWQALGIEERLERALAWMELGGSLHGRA